MSYELVNHRQNFFHLWLFLLMDISDAWRGEINQCFTKINSINEIKVIKKNIWCNRNIFFFLIHLITIWGFFPRLQLENLYFFSMFYQPRHCNICFCSHTNTVNDIFFFAHSFKKNQIKKSTATDSLDHAQNTMSVVFTGNIQSNEDTDSGKRF